MTRFAAISFPKFVCAVLLLVLFAQSPANAADKSTDNTAGDAIKFVEKLADTAITQLASRKISDSERVRRMRKLLTETFDLNEVGRLVLGAYYNRFSPVQIDEFNQLYVLYVAHNYAGLLKRYNGQRIEVVRARRAADGTEIVRSLIHQPAGPPFTMDIRLRPHGDSFKAIDFRIEGISMPLVHRKEFASVISRHHKNGVGELIKALRVTTRRFEAENPSQ